MGPDAKKPMAIAAIAVLLVVAVFLKGFAPLVRFYIIQDLFARWRARRRARNINGSTSVPASFRNNRLVSAIFGARPATSNVDVEQATAAQPSTPWDPSNSTSSVNYPPPAYIRHDNDERYNGPVAYYHPSGNPASSRPRATLPLPPYASSPSLPIAPGTPIAVS